MIAFYLYCYLVAKIYGKLNNWNEINFPSSILNTCITSEFACYRDEYLIKVAFTCEDEIQTVIRPGRLMQTPQIMSVIECIVMYQDVMASFKPLYTQPLCYSSTWNVRPPLGDISENWQADLGYGLEYLVYTILIVQ